MDLLPWQPNGVDFLRTHPGAILGDEQGLGKTVMFISAAKQFNGPVLCIVRPLAKLQTSMMIKEWDPGTPIVRCVEAGVFAEDVVKEWFDFPQKRGYLLIHHEALRRISKKLREMGVWTIVWVDECHRVANPRAQVTKALKEINAFYKWGTSGTLVDRLPTEMWSILNWFQPHRFSSYWDWDSKYVETIRNPRTDQPIKKRAKNLSKFAEEVAPYYLRRTALEVGMDQPLYETVYLELYPKQLTLYNTLKTETLAFIERESSSDPVFIKNALQRMHLLQRVTISPDLVDSFGPSVKFDYIKDFLEDYTEQVIIFTHARAAASRLAGTLPSAMAMAGDTPEKDRDRIMTWYKEGKFQALVAVTDLAAESLSLGWVSKAVFLDIHPSSRMMAQAEMRVRRADSIARPKIYYLIANKTVDEPLLRLYQGKLSAKEAIDLFIRREQDAIKSNSH